jgi:uncharacterized protein YdgA (DUF945 family)
MKKTLVAAGVVIALGIIWTGGAWYTGKQLESRLGEMISQANEQIKRTAPEASVELSSQNYHRGLFSSQMELVVKPVEGKENHGLSRARPSYCMKILTMVLSRWRNLKR